VRLPLSVDAGADVERLSARLDPQHVVVAAGAEASTQVVVTNAGTIVEHVRFALDGSAAAWSLVDPAELRIMPGQTGAAIVRLRPPRASTTPAGRTP